MFKTKNLLLGLSLAKASIEHKNIVFDDFWNLISKLDEYIKNRNKEKIFLTMKKLVPEWQTKI